MSVGVVLPAGGRGLRLGEALPKQFLELSPGRPLFLYAIETFHALPEVEAMVLVLAPEYLPIYSDLPKRYPKLRFAPGGADRWLSVKQGVQALPPTCPTVLIHDIARPFVTPDQIRACIAAARHGHCCTLAMPCVDTIKQVDGNTITATLDRGKLIAVQTPQGFPRAVLDSLYAGNAAASNPPSRAVPAPTDECMLAESAGHKVIWVQGGPNVRKVTDAEDLLWAKWMAARQESQES